MKKIIIFIYLFLFASAYAAGHLSDKDKKATLKCTGLYYANSMIPQGTLKLDKIVHSIAAKKFMTERVLHLKSFLFLSTSSSCRQIAYLKQRLNIVNLN